MAGPLATLKVAARAAKRRRYAYAALRVLRRGLGRAMEKHIARSCNPMKPYITELRQIRELYARAYTDLFRKFGHRLDLGDERARP